MSVFFRIGPIAVTVFEIEAKIFDWFALQFFHDAIEDFLRQFVIRVTEGVGQTRGVGRVFLDRAQGDRAEALRGVGLKKMRAAINGMHGLAAIRFAGITPNECLIRFA